MDLIKTSGKDAYKQFGTVWMLACTGNHFTASVVHDVVLGGVSSVVNLAVLEKIKVQSFNSVESFQDPKIASGNPS